MVRSRDRARTAALQTEVVALRATVTSLRAELAAVQAAAVVPSRSLWPSRSPRPCPAG